MKAIAFKTKIQNKQICIPIDIQKQLEANSNRNVRVIVLLDETEEDNDFSEITTEEFLKGYVDSDSIYDN